MEDQRTATLDEIIADETERQLAAGMIQTPEQRRRGAAFHQTISTGINRMPPRGKRVDVEA
ncbi:MAG TPA: hypothetical protein VM487_15895 [Phycisphaerae bacterium]|nr:hypothetical protein [Phycisphaerae bacterium]